MDNKTILEIIGTIEKKEKFASLDFDDLVIESLFPFPGYHGTTVPDQTKPKSVFLVCKTKHADEDIIRQTIEIKKDTGLSFDASPGSITIQKDEHPCIRIRDLKNYLIIPELIQAYKNHGVEFHKGKRIGEFIGNIKILKYFLLDELDNGVYMDKESSEMGYFEIPVRLDFATFEKITLQIKRNIKENNWDGALGVLYRKKGIVDVIRIYDQNVCLGQCLFLLEKYKDEINRYLKSKQ